MTSMAMGKTTKKFQAEINQLLSIVVNSLYTRKEVFLRELISNASDALDKLRMLSLTDPTVLEDTSTLSIFIEIDKEKGTLTISDNGIGMTYDEVTENIGTIAKSGSSKFIESLEESGAGDMGLDLIGQFGVGFYSAFMVAERVVLLTRAPKQELGVRWESSGDGSYEIEQVEKADRGTTVILHLKETARDTKDPDQDFLNQYTIEKHVQRHCNFISYPVRMNFVTEAPQPDQGGGVGDSERETVITEKVLNSIKPIWERSKKDVSREEYLSFYKQQFHDWNEPAEIVHCQGEGAISFSALLFIPSVLPQGLYTGGSPVGLNLYCKRVLVMKNCQELLPDYLRFVRGVVDSPDLSLNISREVLQHNRQLESVRNYIEKKILESLKSILSKDREKYERLWAEFGKVLKGGIFLDHRNAEKLQDLLVFDSSRSVDEKATLREYVERMPESQKAIYYATGEDRSMVERLPQMEVFLASGIEVLYFLDKVDEFLTEHLREYEGKTLQSVSRGELNLQQEQKPGDEEGQGEDQYKDLLEFVRNSLGQKVREVRLSKRLKSSPVCLVSGDTGLSLNMERLMREANQPMFRASRILEINPDHEVIKSIHGLLKEGRDETKLSGLCQLLYDQALIIENEKIEDPIKFCQAVSQLIVDSCGSHQ